MIVHVTVCAEAVGFCWCPPFLCFLFFLHVSVLTQRVRFTEQRELAWGHNLKKKDGSALFCGWSTDSTQSYENWHSLFFSIMQGQYTKSSANLQAGLRRVGRPTKNTCNVIGFVVHRKLSSVFLSLKHRPGGERGRGRSVFCYKCKIFRQTKTKTS